MSWFDTIADVIQGLENGIDPNTGMAPVQSVATPAATPASAPAPVDSSGLGAVQDVSGAAAPVANTPQALSRAIYHPAAIQAPNAWDSLVQAAATGTNFNDVWDQAQKDYIHQMANSGWAPNQNIGGSMPTRFMSSRPTTRDYEAYYNQGPHAAQPSDTVGTSLKPASPDWFGGLFGFGFADGGATGGISDTLPYVERRN